MIELRGVDRTYRVEYATTNALARLEEATGMSFPEALLALAVEPDLQVALGFVKAGLGDDPLAASPEAVEAVLEDIGGLRFLQGIARQMALEGLA